MRETIDISQFKKLSLEKKRELTDYLRGFMLPGRFETMERVAALRTRKICVVAEDVFQPLNASALIRSCDVFGVQDFHVIESRNRFLPDTEVAMGAQKWISIRRWGNARNNVQHCIDSLRNSGYRIVATSPHKEDCMPDTFPLDGKVALFFGSETIGLSEEVLSRADDFLKIPMSGFTESLNVSVSCAVILSRLLQRLREECGDWKLSEDERDGLLFEWAMKSVKSADRIIERKLVL